MRTSKLILAILISLAGCGAARVAASSVDHATARTERALRAAESL